MTTDPVTVKDYLRALPDDRRSAIAAVRAAVRKHLPAGYEEHVAWGMLAYTIPLSRYPDTYNGQPLCIAALGVQKRHNALHLMCVNGHDGDMARLRAAFAAAGKRLDMGKACIRFTTADDLPLDAIGALLADLPPEAYIARYEIAVARARASRPAVRRSRAGATGRTRSTRR
jgi:hypothetical protein